MGSGLCGGTSLVMMKSFGEILNGSDLHEHKFMALLFVAIGLSMAATQTYLLNLSMKYFNNTDVMPIYQSFILINWMVSGLVLLDESKLYTWGELLRLAASCLLVIAGIFILTRKQSEIVVQLDDAKTSSSNSEIGDGQEDDFDFEARRQTYSKKAHGATS